MLCQPASSVCCADFVGVVVVALEHCTFSMSCRSTPRRNALRWGRRGGSRGNHALPATVGIQLSPTHRRFRAEIHIHGAVGVLCEARSKRGPMLLLVLPGLVSVAFLFIADIDSPGAAASFA